MAWSQRRRPSTEYVPPSTRARIVERDQGICHLCGHEDAEQCDHIVPWSQGGTHDEDNLAPAHGRPCPTCGRECHEEKSRRERIEALKSRPNRRLRPAERHPGTL